MTRKILYARVRECESGREISLRSKGTISGGRALCVERFGMNCLIQTLWLYAKSYFTIKVRSTDCVVVSLTAVVVTV